MEPLSQSYIQGSFRSRRSHTSLHHISLAPLTSRFPLDGDDGPDPDYIYSNDDEREPSRRFPYSPHHATSSYLASASVPATPPILSRNTSYTNLSKRKTTPTLPRMSRTKLDKMDSEQTRHHRRSKSSTTLRPKLYSPATHQDSEWLLRAGLALSSSTREEKGQSWLVKRDSSTSLVSEEVPDKERRRYSHLSHRNYSRRQRSGLSTPVALSRRASNSHMASKFGSRVDLSMTAASLTEQTSEDRASISDDSVGLVPDFVDESLHSEMAAMSPGHISQVNTPSHGGDHNFDDGVYQTISRRNSAFDSSYSVSTSEFSDSETDDEEEVDEAEMKRLTRERGLGLGRWIDRLVEWTLFSVEDEIPGVTAEPSRQPRQFGDIQHQNSVEEPSNNSNQDEESSETEGENQQQEADETSVVQLIENPGDEGGWSDVGWLLRVAKSIAF
ncbi:ornithine carbamoyltransferase, mitochondrial precursor [Histoplasma capsulatum G186AR]|uniref:Ornithine carbamoyltransferase, mitochondrial n=1 Tax=Ajellomyces capsulatus TaxID=5037 RepID=A0A8H7ZA77_AJECA|nr:ornithine carbamoyltransferase, mitochondrial precursor [Histoplasma capsulatum]QSS69482.1 ornithine carbamoyltransferase, mitochondrial precursor [Histoplasma capsulatum G186AR]